MCEVSGDLYFSAGSEPEYPMAVGTYGSITKKQPHMLLYFGARKASMIENALTPPTTPVCELDHVSAAHGPQHIVDFRHRYWLAALKSSYGIVELALPIHVCDA
jgi:hypothetical protein